MSLCLRSFLCSRRGALWFGAVGTALMILLGLLIVERVQSREQKNGMERRALETLGQFTTGTPAAQLPGVERAFVLKPANLPHNLVRFSFVSGWDRMKPDAQFAGELTDPSTRRLHDLAAAAVYRNSYEIAWDHSGPVSLVIAAWAGKDHAYVVVMPQSVPPPAFPWMPFLIAGFLALLCLLLIPASWAPLAAFTAAFVPLLVFLAGYRITPYEGTGSHLSAFGAGMGHGTFRWFFAAAALVLAAAGAAWKHGIAGRFFTGLREHRVAMTYVVPAMIGMLVLVLVPFAAGLALGFFSHCNGNFAFVGLRNFWEILSGGGAAITHPLNFWFTLGVTLMWTLFNVVLHVGIGLGLALLLKDPLLRMKGVYRVLLIIPWAMPNYITALMWKGMFQQQYGAINVLLDSLGIGSISWFSTFWPSFMANVITNTWLGFPFMMVVSLGALQSIPTSLYEAAEVDGASRWQQFRLITLPLLRPALFPAIVLGSIWTFNMFNIIYLVSAGEPGGSTDILITEAYQWAFKRGERYGLAAAYAALIFVVLLLYSKMANRLTRAGEDM
ncbi:MAG: hypothetical protein CVU65_18305 [Deltaproteobacteria bacterium HGW-Deltaproteobacteria-22]|nr:MAG: hypothetical protein CVU65_18305 [Deltaproteobacteria bacterium HGW-Deltaproteobacteria-22]